MRNKINNYSKYQTKSYRIHSNTELLPILNLNSLISFMNYKYLKCKFLFYFNLIQTLRYK